MTYMLDTNICIYAMKNKYESVLENLRKHKDDGLCISAITLAEMEYGVCKSMYPEKNKLALLQFMALLNIVSFDDNAAVEYGRICADLQKKGTPIGTMDMLIAAHAKSNGFILVTNNTKEFERVNDLKIENWS